MHGKDPAGLPRRGEEGDLVLTMPIRVCPKVKDMGPFLASRELNE